MRRLISQYEQAFKVREDDEAARLKASWGLARAAQLAEVFYKTAPLPLRAFWFRVGFILSQEKVPAENLRAAPGRERVREERSVRRVRGRLSVAVMTARGVRRITIADYRRKTKRRAC